MAPSLRITFALLGVAGFGLLLCATIILGSVDRLSLRTTEANIDYLLNQLRDTIEANVGLGLPLAQARVVQNLVERAKAADGRVLAAEVFSPVGLSLFNTDRGSIGESIPASWRNAVRNRIVNDRWRVEELGGVVVGQVIRNDFGEPVGYLALTISDEARELLGEQVLTALAARMAIVAPVGLAIVFLVAFMIFERSSRDVALLAEGLRAPAPSPGHASGLAALAPKVHSAVDRAIADFDRATADVLKADDA